MEWLMAGAFWSFFADQPLLPERECLPATRPTQTDLRLIRLVYDFTAAETGCAKCTAVLGRDLHLVVSAGTRSPYWQIVVVTRCHGRRRHRHTAAVAEGRGELLLGPWSA